MSRYVMALDQGTTSSRAILFDRDGALVAVDQHEFTQHFPQPGWVEHDPAEIWESQLRAARGVLAKAGARGADVAAIGITNQRETTVVWDRAQRASRSTARSSGSRARARRSARSCARAGSPKRSRAHRAGDRRLLLGHQDPLHPRRGPGRAAARGAGELAFGTVDSWLLHRLTRGRVHATEYSNASRTLLFNIHALDWDDVLLARAAHPARDAAGGARLERGLRRSPTPSGSARRSRSRGSPATSRPRSSARAAPPRAAPRTPTAPAASC